MEQRELRPGGLGERGALVGWGLGGLFTPGTFQRLAEMGVSVTEVSFVVLLFPACGGG